MTKNFDPTNIRAVLFDKDGTLIDSERPSFDIWTRVFAEHGERLSLEDYIQFIGKNRADDMEIMRSLGLSVDADTLFFACVDAVNARFESAPCPVKPGVAELLDLLDARGIKKAVATSARQHNAELTLEGCGLLHRMDAVVTGDMVKNGKPAPDIFLMAADLLSVSPAHCLVLEDSDSGIRAAHAAGMPSILIPDMAVNEEDVAALYSCRLDSMFDVVRLFEGAGQAK